MGLPDTRPIIFHVITRLELGGAQETTLATVRLLSPDRFEPVLGFGPGGILDDEARAIPGIRRYEEPELGRRIRPIRDLAALLSLRRTVAALARGGRPVIVHTHSSKAGIVGRWAARLGGATAVVHTVHGFGHSPSQPPLLRWFLVALERITARVTDRIIFVSEANRDQAALLGIRPRGGSALIRSALPVEEFFPDTGRGLAWRSSEGIPAEAPLVGMVACLKPQKDPLGFVALAERVRARVPSAGFVLAGDGELRAAVEREVDRRGLGGSFRLLGFRRDIPDLLRALDCLVLTSRWEGLPKAVVEGLLTGVPVIANRVDGVGEVIARFGGGETVEAGDVPAMADRVAGILNRSVAVRPADRDSLAREFDERAMVRRHEELYRSLLRSSR